MSAIPRTISRSLSIKNPEKVIDIPEDGTGESDKDSIEQVRIKVKKFFATSFLGIFYTNVLLFMSVFSCLQFIVQTYMRETDTVRLHI